MRMRIAAALLSVMACAPLCTAQESKDRNGPPPSVRRVEEGAKPRPRVEPGQGGDSLPLTPAGASWPDELPSGENSWVVRVVTGGGFAGGVRDGVTVTSAGGLSCAPPAAPCADKPADAALNSLSQLIAAAAPSKWKNPTAGTCFDCYTTSLVLQRREKGGVVKTYTADWDVTTVATTPAEVMGIYRAVAGLASGRAGEP